MQKGPKHEPETLSKRYSGVVFVLTNSEPFQKVEDDTDHHESPKGAVPYVMVEGVKEFKVRLFRLRYSHQYTYVTSHKGFGKVHRLLSLGIDAERGNQHGGVLEMLNKFIFMNVFMNEEKVR